MKRLLLPLWLVGAVLYTISTLYLTNVLWLGDDPAPPAKEVTSTSPAYPKVAKVEPPETAPTQPEQFKPINPVAADTSQATRAEGEAAQAPASSIPNPAELLQVTSAASIRNGPSASADIIGEAYAGAEVRVASRDSGWTQIVDPSS